MNNEEIICKIRALNIGGKEIVEENGGITILCEEKENVFALQSKLAKAVKKVGYNGTYGVRKLYEKGNRLEKVDICKQGDACYFH